MTKINISTSLLLLVIIVIGFSSMYYVNEIYNENQKLLYQYEEMRSKYQALLERYESLNESYNHLLNDKNITKIEVLEDHEYFSKVKSIIETANESIYVAIYVVKYDPKEYDDPVNQLLYALVDAKKRGLDVRVLVDDPTLRSYPDTISFLKNNSIPIRLDKSKGVTSHMKIVIIDGKYLIIGSHNWTESALSYNHEYSVLIVSKHYSEAATKYFLSLWSEGRNI